MLNRIQSKDLHAFATLQANTQQPVSSEEPTYPRSDEGEARQLLEQYGSLEGIGEVIYSQEELDLAADLGLDLE